MAADQADEMRSDIGLSTISQRLAGLASLRAAPRPIAAQAPTAGAGSFADALSAQLATADQRAAAGLSAAGATTGGAATVSQQPAMVGAAALLGQGTRLTGQPSVIVPGTPGVGSDAVGLQGAEGVHGVEPHDHVHPPVVLDRTGPPAELQAYGNGRIPPDALQPLGVGDHRLWSPAAEAFRDMAAAAERDGVDIGINDSYRSYDRQVEMVDRYGLYSQGGRAASPGTSNHGWGVAVDLQLDDNAKAWMREHARDYGFVEDVPREPWHWTFKASTY